MSNPFGSSSSSFGSSFGAQSSNQPQQAFGGTSSLASPFGQSSGTTFGSPGNPTLGSGSAVFGATTGSNAFGSGSAAFGSTASSRGFGAGSPNTGFGVSSGGFGGSITGTEFQSGVGSYGGGSAFGTTTVNTGFGTSNAGSGSGGFGGGFSGSTPSGGFGSSGFGQGSSGLSSSGGFGATFSMPTTAGGFGTGSVVSISSGSSNLPAFGKSVGFGSTTQPGGSFGTTLSTSSSGFGTAGGFGPSTGGTSSFGTGATFGATNKQGSKSIQMSSSGNAVKSLNSQPTPAFFGQGNVFSSSTAGSGAVSSVSASAKNAFGTSTSSVYGNSTTTRYSPFGAITGTGSAPFGGMSSAPSGIFRGGPPKESGSFGGPTQSTSSQFKSLTQTDEVGQKFGAKGSSSSGLFGKGSQMFGKPESSNTSNEGGAARMSRQTGFGQDELSQGSKDNGTGEIVGLVPPASKFILRTSAPKAIQSTASNDKGIETSTTKSKKTLFQEEAHSGHRPGASQVLFGKAIAGSQNRVWKRTTDGEEARKIKRKSSDGTEEENQAKRTTMTRRLSVADDKDRVALICKNVLPQFNNSQKLRQHFSKFGEVARVFPKPERGMATIHFKTHESALEAKKRGAVIMKGEKRMELFWSSYSPAGKVQARKSSAEDATGQTAGPIKRQAQDTTRLNQHKWRRSEVDDELASMSGTGDLSQPQQEVKVHLSQSIERGARHSSPVPSTSGSSVAMVTKIDQGSIITLKNSTARSNSDKLHILNLRDKVNRHGSKKQADLATAKAFVGSCTDMCPEKERYDREEKRRLHNYEVLQGTEGTGNPQVNHSLAVKEYSRSSADQEEPLPYELRTLPTLTLTMTYLLSEIADRGEDGKWGDWFDFLWNRTRGIRKEITQQQFCNTESTALLEKCVRFHIFCAERLCEEDMHSFDDKINNENMTKCLQTLKENYSDLEKKQEFCPNEAEMRCYMVLMNLNQGDILRETQQLRPDVRNTTYINYALQVYAALNSNNFVRFFRLVRGGSFLCACIMHRYFTQVRKKALQILIKAYRKGVQLPLDDLLRTMGFDDQNEAAQFCQFFGLTTVDNCVTLDRAAFIDPEENWCPRRSALIEHKRNTSIGEAINGGPLPVFSPPKPENSFDENGRFIGQIIVKASDLVDSQRKEPKSIRPETDQAPVSSERVVTPQPPAERKPKVTFSLEEVKEEAKLLFWEVIDGLCLEIGQEVKRDMVDPLMDFSLSVYDSVSTEVVTKFVLEFADAVKTLQEQQKAEREAQARNAAAVQITSEILKEVLNEETLNSATEEFREVQAELKRQRIERCSAEVAMAILNTSVLDMTHSLSEEFYQKDVVERLQRLADQEHCVKVKRAGRFFQMWKAQHSARIKFKRSMLDFPSSSAMMDPAQQVEALIPDGRREEIQEEGFYVTQTTKLSLESPVEYVKRLEAEEKVLTAHEIYRNLCRQKAWKPLDVGSLIGHQLLLQNKGAIKRDPSCGHIFWKLLISLPDPDLIQTQHQGQGLQQLTKWLKAKFHRGTSTSQQLSSVQNELLSLYKVPVTLNSLQGSLGVCVRLLEGNIAIGDIPGSLQGASGLLFVLPPAISEDPEWSLWEDEKRRLEVLLRNKPISPPLPLVVICPVPANESVDENFVQRCLNIDDLVAEKMISYMSLCVIQYDEDLPEGIEVNDPEVTEKLSDRVRWLAEQFPGTLGLQTQYCRSVVEDFLQEHFYSRVLYNLKQRKLQGYLHQDPNTMISLYNAGMVHLQQVLTSPKLSDHSWPVSEFTHSRRHDLPPLYWNTDQHLTMVSDLLADLQLPSFIYGQEEKDDWSTVCQDVWAYVQRIVDGFSPSNSVDFTSKIRVLLHRTRQDFEETCDLCTGVSRCDPTYINMPWTDLIMACVEFKISEADFMDPNSETGMDELVLAYDKEALLAFDPPSEWRYLENDQDRGETVPLETTFQRAAAKKCSQKESLSNNRHKSASVRLKEKSTSLDPLPKTVHDATQTSTLLSTTIEEEKLKSKQFEKYLKSLVNGSDLNKTNIPDISNLPAWSVFEYEQEESEVSQNSIQESFCEAEASVWSYGPYNLDKTLGQPRISEQFVQLEEDLKTQRRASDVFELQLQRWMQEGI